MRWVGSTKLLPHMFFFFEHQPLYVKTAQFMGDISTPNDSLDEAACGTINKCNLHASPSASTSVWPQSLCLWCQQLRQDLFDSGWCETAHTKMAPHCWDSS